MANVEIVLDSAGIQALLKSSEMASVCEAEASRMTRATGMKYVPDVRVGKTRVNAGGYNSYSSSSENESSAGKQVSGYYRRLKNGKKIYVQSYRRKK